MAKTFDEGPTLNSELQRSLVSSQKREREAQLKAGTDHLTGVFNRRALDEQFPEVIKRLNQEGHKRESDPDYIIFIILDINHFKLLNDTHGHPKGDEALKIVARRLEQEVNERGGKVFRFGGDEFAIIQEVKGNLTDNQLQAISPRIQSKVNSDLFIPIHDGKFDITVSMGSSILKKGENKTAEQLIKDADEKMYIFKNGNGIERRR